MNDTCQALNVLNTGICPKISKIKKKKERERPTKTRWTDLRLVDIEKNRNRMKKCLIQLKQALNNTRLFLKVASVD